MGRSWINRHTGICDMAVKQGQKGKEKKNVEERNRVKNVCLTCEKPDCDGCRGRVFTKHGVREKKASR